MNALDDMLDGTLDIPSKDPFKGFAVCSVKELRERVDMLPPVKWLVQPILTQDSYGIIGAAQKIGKTWIAVDLAVSVSSGTPFLGGMAVEQGGPVLLFCGEGGDRKILRRIDAVARSRDLDSDQLLLYTVRRAPHLNDDEHLAEIRALVVQFKPVLVIIDPLYFCLPGVKMAGLSEVGAILERVQHIAQNAGSALIITHHWNQSGKGSDANRFSGVGSAEWGRVLISVSKVSLKTDADTKQTDAILRCVITGDEVSEYSQNFRRTERSEAPDDPGAPLQYEVNLIEDDLPVPPAGQKAGHKHPPSELRVFDILRNTGEWMDKQAIGDATAAIGHPLAERTIQEACKQLVDRGQIEASATPKSKPTKWRVVAEADAAG